MNVNQPLLALIQIKLFVQMENVLLMKYFAKGLAVFIILLNYGVGIAVTIILLFNLDFRQNLTYNNFHGIKHWMEHCDSWSAYSPRTLSISLPNIPYLPSRNDCIFRSPNFGESLPQVYVAGRYCERRGLQ